MPRTAGGGRELLCPGCGKRYGGEERFCPDCSLPLIQAAGVDELPEASERHRLARKVKPQLGEGELIRIAGARNLAEAEFIQGMLLEEGVPSIVRRSAGFDVPDFLAAGPRDILVAQTGYETAREVLLQAELISTEPGARVVTPGRLMAGLIAALVLGVLLVWLATAVFHH